VSRVYSTIEPPQGEAEAPTIIEAGAFPLDALGGIQERIVDELATVHMIDPALPGMAAVATVAGAIGNSHVVRGAVNGKETPLNVYVTAGAPKSYGKGASSAIVRPMIEASTEMAEAFRDNVRPQLLTEQTMLEARHKAIVNMLAKDGTKKNSKPLTEYEKEERRQELTEIRQRLDIVEKMVRQLPTYWIGNATTPAMVDSLLRNGESIFSYSPEAGDLVRVALGKFSKDGAADFDLMLSGYSVEPYRETRVGRGDNMLTPCISALWYCQPFLLRELAGNEEALERGLTARCLSFVCEHSEIPEDDGQIRTVNEAATRDWDRLVRAILDDRDKPEATVIECTPEAREIFRDFHNESVRLRNGEFRDIEGELGRWRENAVRIAGGLCVADFYSAPGEEPLSLTADHAARGVRLARWACFSTLEMMQAGRKERRLERVKKLVAITSEEGGRITLRDLNRSHGFNPEEVRALARDFPAMIEVEKITHGEKGGRPSEVAMLPVIGGEV
jgi:hypothetical protein